MLKRINKILVAVIFASLIVSGGCSLSNDNNKASEREPSDDNVSVFQQSDENNSDSVGTGNTGKESSTSNTASTETSDESSLSESTVGESTEDSSGLSDESDIADESSYVNTPDESSAAQVSFDGYQFDDEQIVDDYHTAAVFTSNDTFNEIFAENALDKEYANEQQNAGTSSEMRQVTAAYSAKWKDKVSEVFTKLDALLADRPEEYKKLLRSQEEWTDGLPEAESSFYAEASGAGTEGLIAAEAAVMNYYKGRTAILLEQIYELNGEIDLGEYGL